MPDHPPIAETARHWLGHEGNALARTERHVLDHLSRRRTISRDAGAAVPEGLGARMADRVAAFGGSWTFIGIFAATLILWCGLNLALGREGFDPYPFIFLNLVLSMLAAVQAPIIMMSQNRQAERDRQAAAHDYEVNLKSELEIMALHDKLDRLRLEDLEPLIQAQGTQLAAIEAHLATLTSGVAADDRNSSEAP